MADFLKFMQECLPTANDAVRRRWLYVPYDRLNDRLGLLTENPDAGLIFVESHAKGRNRPYHRKKVMLVLSNQRHFAMEQVEFGRKVIYLNAPESFGEQLRTVQERLGLGPILAT